MCIRSVSVAEHASAAKDETAVEIDSSLILKGVPLVLLLFVPLETAISLYS